MYGKIFSSLYQGTLRGKAHAILVFMNLIASCDKCGIADRHWRAIADEVGLSIDEVKAAIEYLESPDEESRSKEHDGRRLIRVAPDRAWGWVIVNYGKYRDMRDEEDRRVYMREYMRKSRQAPETPPPVPPPLTSVNNLLTSVSNVNSVSSRKLPLAKAEAHADAEVHATPLENILTPPPSPGAQPREADAGADAPTPPGGGGGARHRVSGLRPSTIRDAIAGANVVDLVSAYGCNVKGRQSEWKRDTHGMQLGEVATILHLALSRQQAIREPSGWRDAVIEWKAMPIDERREIGAQVMAELGIELPPKQEGT